MESQKTWQRTASYLAEAYDGQVTEALAIAP
ncbi:hypothetical protein EcE24377A_D0030 (plasmid) [Escherichia coli O139:H28 str. E24377A]|uniref:Uncharacterized protein n=1 Tax=Escherichia coli O139:H28 (strain E24377A / ETEC) TaxID=331111 RepID=A7ZGX6_ECO24|nr:hypothetical protein EcE24377A_D0030 [Escherichia coli O139:H28 str. E24377A]